MKGTIIKILPKKYSRNGGTFTRINFKMEDGTFTQTDLVDSYRNVARWKNLLRVGIDLDGLIMKSKNKVNADSFPREIKAGVKQEWQEDKDGNMTLVDVIIDIEPKLDDVKLIQEHLF